VETVLFGGGLQAETYLPRSAFNRGPLTFGSLSCFLDSDGPVTFDSRSGVSVYWHLFGSVGVSSGAEAVECLSKYVIRN
jgi:hypothetical protein